MNGNLDGVAVRSQFQCAAAPTVAQGIGDELGHEQDHGVRHVRGNGRLLQTFEEGSCRVVSRASAMTVVERTAAALAVTVIIRVTLVSEYVHASARAYPAPVPHPSTRQPRRATVLA
ncbi:hypothetical protein ACFYQT_02700 [Streptomyces tibetensis]|uniref:Uncharacterized protein n=2 Tax=Streptomyces tibetensis TaxID=2382123 RepID=A0ABW6MMU3_9ACTN